MEFLNGIVPKWPNGQFKNQLGFQTNGPPDLVLNARIRDIFKIRKDDDYTISVCPAIYDLGPGGQFFKRVDLPCVAAKIHLSAEKENHP